MKKLLIMAVAACCLAACNKELGPEYKVAPVISGVTFSPQEVHAGENVHVSATVTSEYGFTGISILYSLNEVPCRRSPNRSRCPTPKRINLPHYNLIWN